MMILVFSYENVLCCLQALKEKFVVKGYNKRRDNNKQQEGISATNQHVTCNNNDHRQWHHQQK